MKENILCSRIGELRRDANMTQEQLAQRLGITYQAVSKWENGLSCPDVMLLPDIADIFGVSLDALFGVERQSVTAAPVPVAGSGPVPPVVGGCLPWPDDENYYAVLFRGHALVSPALAYDPEYDGGDIELDDIQASLMSHFRVRCGDVSGSVHSCSFIDCGDVGGNANASGDIECGDVGGMLDAGGDVSCGDIGGNANAGGDMNCGDIDGSASAGGDINCSDIGGNASAGGDMNCGDIDGNAFAGGSMGCGDDDSEPRPKRRRKYSFRFDGDTPEEIKSKVSELKNDIHTMIKDRLRDMDGE